MTPDPLGVPVVLELIALSVGNDGLCWRRQQARVTGQQSPDALARALTGLDGPAAPADVVLHSTSWRHTGTELVLTYAVFPDPQNQAGRPLHDHVVTGPGPLHPTPLAVEGGHIAAHAARHLADLAGGRDPHVTTCAQRSPNAWGVLAEHARGVHVADVEHHPVPVPVPVAEASTAAAS